MSYMKQTFVYTHSQELDLIELGPQAAKCIKGENRSDSSGRVRAALIAGRAHRGLARRAREQRSNEFWIQDNQRRQRRLAHIHPPTEAEQLQLQLEQLRRRESLLRETLKRQASTLHHERTKRAALEKETKRLRSTIRIVEEAVKNATRGEELGDDARHHARST